jgi:hypothetical protein
VRRIWKDYGLSITLASLFLASWVAHFLVERTRFADEQATHGRAFSWSEYWPVFWTATLENWQSEFLQLVTFVVLSAYLSHKGSPESRDSEEKTERKLDEILRRVKALEGEGGEPAERVGPHRSRRS